MTTADHFLSMMRQRRAFPRGSLEWEWRTRAARTYARIMMGIPACEWAE